MDFSLDFLMLSSLQMKKKKKKRLDFSVDFFPLLLNGPLLKYLGHEKNLTAGLISVNHRLG